MRHLLVVSCFFASACGQMTQDEFVEETSAVLCTQIYACATAEVREAMGELVGSTQAECATLTAADGGLKLVADCVFSGEKAQACVDGLAALSCEDFSAHVYPDSCDQTCASGS